MESIESFSQLRVKSNFVILFIIVDYLHFDGRLSGLGLRFDHLSMHFGDFNLRARLLVPKVGQVGVDVVSWPLRVP